VQCFSHETLVRCFSSSESGADVSVHKHCLHALNFTVKVRYEDLVQQTGYRPGPLPSDFGTRYSKKDLEAHLVFRPHVNTRLYFEDASTGGVAGAPHDVTECTGVASAARASVKRARRPSLPLDSDEDGDDAVPRLKRDEHESRSERVCHAAGYVVHPRC
jgi:hypothetical protein